MAATDYDDLRPDRVREVFVQPDAHGDWIPGVLEAVERRHGEWACFVRYTRGVAHTYIAWFPEHRIRCAELRPHRHS